MPEPDRPDPRRHVVVGRRPGSGGRCARGSPRSTRWSSAVAPSDAEIAAPAGARRVVRCRRRRDDRGASPARPGGARPGDRRDRDADRRGRDADARGTSVVYPAGVPAIATYSILPDPLEALAARARRRDRLPGPAPGRGGHAGRDDAPRRDPRAARGRGTVPRGPGRERRGDRRVAARAPAAPRRHRRPRHLRPRRGLRPVRARRPASADGRARDAVDRLDLRRGAGRPRRAGHRHQPVGRVAGHRRGRRRGRAPRAPRRSPSRTSPESALAAAADRTIALGAGPERAIAATKTYTAELLASPSCRPPWPTTRPTARPSRPSRTRSRARSTLEPEIERIAADQAATTRALVIARGFEYATAREWALKLKELARVFADPTPRPISSTDRWPSSSRACRSSRSSGRVRRARISSRSSVGCATELGGELMVVSDRRAGAGPRDLAGPSAGRDARMARADRLDRRRGSSTRCTSRARAASIPNAAQPQQGDPNDLSFTD